MLPVFVQRVPSLVHCSCAARLVFISMSSLFHVFSFSDSMPNWPLRVILPHHCHGVCRTICIMLSVLLHCRYPAFAMLKSLYISCRHSTEPRFLYLSAMFYFVDSSAALNFFVNQLRGQYTIAPRLIFCNNAIQPLQTYSVMYRLCCTPLKKAKN